VEAPAPRVALSPSEALALAADGPEALRRRRDGSRPDRG
jgi:hypothetical protein